MNRQKKLLPLLLAFLLLLPACGSKEEETDDNGIVRLIYATTDPGRVDRQSILNFNTSHKDLSIEVRDYSEADGMDRTGWKRLATEMLAGDCPDIIDLGGELPYRQLALKGYLEDLWPYIERDPDLGREGVMEAPLKAVEVDGGLYTIFPSVYIETLVGPECLVGDRISWSLADLREAFARMPEGAALLPAYYTKEVVFDLIFSMSLDRYVEWDTGACHFDSEPFRAALEFCAGFPADFNWADPDAANEAMCDQMESGLLLLDRLSIMDLDYARVYDKLYDAVFDCGASYVGFPVEDGSVGSSFTIRGQTLAMTSACKNKEAAWEYMRQLLLPRSTEPADLYFPVNRQSFEGMKRRSMNQRGGEPCGYNNFSTMIFETTPLTEREYEDFMAFFNSIEKTSLCDRTIFNIVQECCGPYFAGHKSLEDTAALVQGRVSLYLGENR